MRTIIKILVFVMFVSGVLQWSVIDLSWEDFRVIQVAHILSSIAILFLLLPFIYRHIRRYYFIKKVNSVNGWVVFVLFILLIASGFYLLLVGNRGGDMFGELSFNVHLYGSFLLIILFIAHAFFSEKKQITPLVLLALINPQLSHSQEKLSNIEVNSTRSYHSEDWTSSTKCKSCHSEIFKQWSNSNHKHMVGSNPYYMVMETLAGEVEGEGFRKWCMSCHNPSALLNGHEKTTHDMEGNFLRDEIFEKDGQGLIADFKEQDNFRLEEGVSCVTCHRITDASSKGNASYTLTLERKKYAFEDSKAPLGHWFSEKLINSNPDEHKKSYMDPLYKESRYCASCHDEFHPKNGIAIVSTFKEWEKSEFNNPKDKSKHKTCIDCHMTNLKDGKLSPLRGTSTDGGVIKEDVKVHYFSGSNHFLAGLKDKKNEEQTIELLKSSAKLDVDVKDNTLSVGVTNVGAGHHLPTGVADFRELWLDVSVKDRDDKLVFSSGKLKEDGNIEDDSRVFQKVFGDENGEPVGLLFWRYKILLKDTRIPSKQRRVESFALSKSVKYPLSVEVKLNFRIYPQWTTDAVKKAFPTLPNPPIIELMKVEKEFK
ncbi:MAG: multiheme c-type cytochrome [Sulfurimonas sp.]|uniref:multiheme c-type cytochrome n=1 Tax=Sulfurimonas sp. TaxID=2022749 RepID=UPI0026371AB8|nr:multiheme c-type cytochrome [Sulfurimonas sp.]MDD3475667.1 multiheme c-type cytochrome [Sulfurimonas sp.]